MKAKQWRAQIVRDCEALGVYRPAFAPVVATLADILEQRDAAYAEFLRQGGKAVVERVSDRGSVNLAKNPLLQTWADLNAQALAYWRNLGLTPAGFKKLAEQEKQAKSGPLAALEAMCRRDGT